MLDLSKLHVVVIFKKAGSEISSSNLQVIGPFESFISTEEWLIKNSWKKNKPNSLGEWSHRKKKETATIKEIENLDLVYSSHSQFL